MEELSEILKEFSSKIIKQFIEWAESCGEDVFYVFEHTDEAIERFFEERKK